MLNTNSIQANPDPENGAAGFSCWIRDAIKQMVETLIFFFFAFIALLTLALHFKPCGECPDSQLITP
jgi:hypothetical protein